MRALTAATLQDCVKQKCMHLPMLYTRVLTLQAFTSIYNSSFSLPV